MLELMYRYASKEMRDLWSENNRFSTWRKIWVALAESQFKAGVTCIKPEQIKELSKHIDSHRECPQQIQRLSVLEKDCKHDVVAHIRLLGEICPAAKDIIHLGATSCDITDNADILLIRDGLKIIKYRLIGVIDSLATLAEFYQSKPCLAYTHYQPAQLTTIGKRICLWLANFVSDFHDLENQQNSLRLHGLKGATGTQDSYLKLLDNHRVNYMEKAFAEAFEMHCYPIIGQTYSRKVDSQVLSVLSGIGQSSHKFGTDIRLLQHDNEMSEPFGEKQVGSSAMSFKRNPHKSERMCSLSRYLANEAVNAQNTAMLQWLERTLDDSAGRRLYLPACFMAADAILKLALAITNGLHINLKSIDKHVRDEMPFIMTESLLVKAVERGGDRTALYTVLRDLCQEAVTKVREGHKNPLLAELTKVKEFADILPTLDTDPGHYIGRAKEQVKFYIENEVSPIRQRFPKETQQFMEIEV